MENSEIENDPVKQIVESLRQEIVSGALAPNESLRQENLATRFGTSRMPVREAIKELQSLGFVTIEQNKRARVAPVSRADFLEIYDMRIAAETLAIKTAIPQLTNMQIDEAAAIQAVIEKSLPEEFGALNTKFHMTLYLPCARPRLLELIQNLCSAADRYTFMCSVDKEVHDKSTREHYELLDACKARDANAAIASLTAHIGDARDLFAPMLNS